MRQPEPSSRVFEWGEGSAFRFSADHTKLRHLLGDSICLLHARANRRPTQKIAGEEDSRILRAEIGKRADEFAVADIVLGKGAVPARHLLHNWRSVDSENS